MNQEELETYEYQLSQIKLGLVKDPNNTELQTLKSELEDLISLTRQYLGAQAAPAPPAASSSSSAARASSAPSPAPRASPASGRPATLGAAPSTSSTTSSAPQHKFATGDDCSCRYSDGKWYPARITSITGPADQPIYTVVYRGYDTPESCSAGDVRPLSKWDAKEAKEREAQQQGDKRKLMSAAGPAELSKDDVEKERKRRKNEKKAETQKAKAEEASSKAKSWQSFAKKGTKKGVHIPGVAGGSMFRSPDDGNPNAKVGVVGGGRGITQNTQRKRQTFQEGGDD
ncbi:hypothetical protein JCM3775_004301 [Rhodotorula graminis]|uniref:Tudor domain-containing protein n=1 Tax=Rhodotorula graminis (strain WP1) TaxID=578459 RepID=A0A194S4J4_RHOGW|nr:uncharacterized protein RHOBADRAFT_44830 [Rhodotorula graminis WP1]KPV74341.1 hypothetical protein RHOBADRAFT_44830 [Rhodotorula graminis WP1]